ncbi:MULTISPECIES: MarR family transcriptional regulator [unclassified Streptomyces]|uniref:MarR family winged helix-turn-helix transcriptional regulator n=1 Tax=unclassified Streptomyces TaxID=2593676 RepID=UPI0020342746|nr:MarR family transcriptional regulator [Streptomyces sp. RKAG290]MCM2414296.1 MarR family transcriptional regulator [Streptomyces sp. RKAG290]
MPSRRPEGAASDTSWNQTFSHSMWRANNSVHRALNERLRSLDVTMTQLGIMMTLDQYGPLSGADLARGQNITPQSVTTALAHLERIGWIERHPHPVHGRVVLIEPTEAGLRGMAEGRRLVEAVVQRLSEVVGGPEELNRLTLGMRRIAIALDGPDSPVARMWPDPPDTA